MNDLKDIFNKAQDIRLSQDEKERLRTRLVQEMSVNHHIQTEVGLGKIFISKHKFMGAVVLGLIAMLTLGGGVSYAATDALPGDALYPVKTEVNENVRGWLTVGDEAEAEYRGELAERRLAELEEIAEKRADRLEEVKSNVEARFAKHIADMEARLEALGEDNSDKAAEISGRIEQALENHGRVLDRLEGREEHLSDVSERADEARERVAEKRERFEERIQERAEREDGEVTSERIAGKIGALRNMISSAEKFVSSNPNISDESLEKAKEIISEASDLVDEAERLNESGEYREALEKLNEATRVIHSVRSAISIEVRTGVRDFVRDRALDYQARLRDQIENGDITPEEARAIMQERMEEARENIQNRVEERRNIIEERRDVINERRDDQDTDEVEDDRDGSDTAVSNEV